MKKRASSKTDEAVKLAEEIKHDILSESCSLTNILRKSLILAQLQGNGNDFKWVSYELNGYKAKEKPNYRRCTVHCRESKPFSFSIEWIHRTYPRAHLLSRPIPIIEEYVDKGFTVPHPKGILLSSGEYCKIRPIEIKQTLNAVTNRVLSFANNVLLELKYGGILSGIFDETRNFVDSKLVEISPNALKKLTETYEYLAAGSSELDWAQIAFACREILKDFTDAIFKEEYLQAEEKKPGRNQTKNKLRYALRAIKVESDTTKEMLGTQIDYLLKYFDNLSGYIQKNVHPENFEVTKEDANRCVIYTYLFIGDLLKLLHLGIVEKKSVTWEVYRRDKNDRSLDT